MCGIAGVIYSENSRVPEVEILAELSTSLTHRGPDGHGVYRHPGIGLIHRRLAIIDPVGAVQPMTNEDGTIWTTFNGEIYNYRELRKKLESRGHHFKTQSDTEVLVHLYEEYQQDMVQHLRGMFAFAIWNSKTRELLLARDRFGIKPLYFYRDNQQLIFASEPRAILTHPDLKVRVDVRSLEDYLAMGMVLGPKSIYQGIEQVPPAHLLRISHRHWNESPQRYWALQYQPDYNPNRDWLEEVRAGIEDAVQSHLVSDVPIGAFLSGGIDSGGIVATASKFHSQQLQTFSVGFDDERYCELDLAKEVANQYQTAHHETTLKASATHWLDDLNDAFDEPFADVSAIPTMLVARQASQKVKVALSGDGGDEAFGGYPRYVHDLREESIRRWLPGPMRQVLGWASSIWPNGHRWPRPLRWKNALRNLSLPAAQAYANTVSICRAPLCRQLLHPDYVQKLGTYAPQDALARAFQNAPTGQTLNGMLAADTSVILPDDYLVKVDRASMAFGLEVRPPLLDHRLMELAAQIPPEWKIRNGQTKWILKESFSDRLPKSVLNGTKKGFVIPVNEWLAGPLASQFQERVLSSDSPLRNVLDQKIVGRLFGEHQAKQARHGRILWSLLILAKWWEKYHYKSSPVRKNLRVPQTAKTPVP